MAKASKFPALYWLILAYLVLGVALCWSANQPPHRVAATIFLISLLLCWVPAYIYANRRDMACNRVFWISHASGLIAGLFMAVVLFYFIGTEDPSSDDSSDEWAGWLGGLVIYFITMQLTGSLVKWSATKAQQTVEVQLERKRF